MKVDVVITVYSALGKLMTLKYPLNGDYYVHFYKGIESDSTPVYSLFMSEQPGTNINHLLELDEEELFQLSLVEPYDVDLVLASTKLLLHISDTEEFGSGRRTIYETLEY